MRFLPDLQMRKSIGFRHKETKQQSVPIFYVDQEICDDDDEKS